MKNRPAFSLIMIGIGIIIVITAIIISNPPSNQTVTPQPLVSDEESFPEIERVSLKNGLIAQKAGSAIFIDVRDKSAYEEVHISGALSIPLGQLENRLKELDPNSWIITYCT